LITDSWEVAYMLSIGIEIDGLEWPLCKCTLLHAVGVDRMTLGWLKTEIVSFLTHYNFGTSRDKTSIV